MGELKVLGVDGSMSEVEYVRLGEASDLQTELRVMARGMGSEGTSGKG